MNNLYDTRLKAVIGCLVIIAAYSIYRTCHMPAPTRVIPAQEGRDVVTLIATDGAVVNARDRFGNTPLMNAVRAGKINLVRELLQIPGIDLNGISDNQDGDTIIGISCVNIVSVLEQDAIDVLKELILAGADVNKPNSVGLRPVHICMRIWPLSKRMHVLKMLIEAGAHINSQAVDGGTMLHIAVTQKLADWIRMMNSEFGQIINYDKKQIFNLDRDNIRKLTPLELARALGHVGVASAEEAILNRPKLLGWDFDVTVRDDQGRSPLVLAMLRGDVGFARKMIDKMKSRGDSLYQVAKNGMTSLMYAVMSDEPTTFVATLLEDPGVVKHINDLDGQHHTALLLTTYIDRPSDRIEVANLLFRKGADPMIKDVRGRSLGDRARRLGDPELMQWYNSHKK